jgi:Domain of unknown function (DUF4386)
MGGRLQDAPRVGEDRPVTGPATSRAWERYAWTGGIVFVVALLTEAVISAAIPINQNDSATKIATEVARHRHLVLVAAYLSAVYATAFVIYLCRLHQLLREQPGRPPFLAAMVLIGGVLFVSLHAVSDIGIYGLLGGKIASFGADHDHGISYTLYLLTFALDSVGDVFGSLFAIAAGAIVLESKVLPRWLGGGLVLVAVLFFLQGFGLGGVIATFGLVLDLIGFVLLLILVASSSVILLRRPSPA